jgi:hypothetical protein
VHAELAQLDLFLTSRAFLCLLCWYLVDSFH